MSKDQTRRRNLSGMYFLYGFPEDDGREPTCFEDCPPDKQTEVLDALEPEAVKNLARHLANTIRAIGKQHDLHGNS